MSMPRKSAAHGKARGAAPARKKAAPPRTLAASRSRAAGAAQASPKLAGTEVSGGLAAHQGLLGMLEQMREAQADMLRQMNLALEATRRRAESASGLQDLMRLQGDLASDTLGRTVNAASALFRSWLETEAALLEQAQAQGSALTPQWLHEGDGTAAASNGGAHFESTPGLELLTQAQSAWAEWTQQWIDKLRERQGA